MRPSRTARIAALLLFSLVGCRTFHYEDGGITLGSHHYPGVMIDVGGYDLYFNCTAPAPYTVLLEAGGGMPSLMWKPVQDLLAVIAQFQAPNPPCNAGGSCDYDANGCVGFGDLLKLIAQWSDVSVNPGTLCPDQ